MNLREIKDIIRAIKGTDITEIEIERSGERLKIKRGVTGAPEIKAASSAPSKPSGAPADRDLIAVTSPLVGTFYRSSSLDSPPFVEMGSEVHKGDVLGIVESMKLLNEIESDMDGVVVSIVVENGQPVEYGQTLFLLEPL
jgi:acetyl-CoA carboxylase biotin carboxyl carrier protein